MPVIDRRAVLGRLSLAELKFCAEKLELDEIRDPSRDSVLEALAASQVPLGEMLMTLTRTRLKELCAEQGYDDTGREKIIIATRLLGVDPFSPPKPKAVPPIRRRRRQED